MDGTLKLLLTAFDPFGGEETNASMALLDALPDRLGQAEIRKCILPTVFRLAGDTACRAMDELAPDAVICLGQAGGRDALTPERAAINIMDARIPDNAGAKPADEPIDPDGPAAYFATLPIRPMAEAMTAAGAPARISDSAGTFVCNSVMYAVLRHADRRGLSVPCGFIHVPYLEETHPPDDSAPRLPRAVALRGLLAALECVIDRLS